MPLLSNFACALSARAHSGSRLTGRCCWYGAHFLTRVINVAMEVSRSLKVIR